MGTINYRVGERFGKLTVVSADATVTGRHKKSLCVCVCGTTKSYYVSNLTGGKSTSCGCKSAETLDKIRIGATKHGMSRTKTYKAWASMKGRCLNSYYANYSDYGGRGIIVCERWLESFENFYADMGHSSVNTSLDRIDNDGNYEPSNCKWSTDTEQQNNKRVTTLITAKGKTQTLSKWCLETGLDPQLVRNRIKLHGWSESDAVNTPKKKYRLCPKP